MSYGLRYENKMSNDLKAEGFSCIRSAASKGVDVVAWREDTKTYMIEVKATRKLVPKAFTQVIADTRLHASPHRRTVLAIYIRGKLLWLWTDTMELNEERTTWDIDKARKWVSKRKFEPILIFP